MDSVAPEECLANKFCPLPNSASPSGGNVIQNWLCSLLTTKTPKPIHYSLPTSHLAPPTLAEPQGEFWWIKLLRGKSCRCSAIIRDANGQVLALMADKFLLPHSIVTVEVITTIKALRFALKLGLTSISWRGFKNCDWCTTVWDTNVDWIWTLDWGGKAAGRPVCYRRVQPCLETM